MLTIDTLKEFGADTADGLTRCMNNTDFYLRLVRMALKDQGFEKLSRAVGENDFDAAFEAAHALKGILTNLSLTPISEPTIAITEHLRAKEQMDYKPLVDQILAKKAELEALDQ
ncbi:MAG: Hpt domain-containing protein [Lachnospiraceae bacterium]|nr:Hpt domain-containing protein [Lachnospiraceae bacterium]